MKRILMVCTVAGAIACFAVTGQDPAANTSTPSKAKAAAKSKAAPKTVANKTAPKAAPKAEAITIPKDAKELEPGIYRWVDPKGVAWIYSQTPFGIMRNLEEKPKEAEAVPTDWEATDEGDSITFTRPWPFGTKKWSVKKADLTDTEQAVWQRIQSAKAGK